MAYLTLNIDNSIHLSIGKLDILQLERKVAEEDSNIGPTDTILHIFTHVSGCVADSSFN